MFETFGRTWELTKESAAVLRADKEMLMFPVMSAIATILVFATFLAPLAASGALKTMEKSGASQPLAWVLLFVFYYVSYFVIIFFNSALIACANIRLAGGNPTVSMGLHAASARLGRIAVWAFVASTVGLLLNMLEERAGWLGKIVIAIIGVAWTLATYFMVPVVLFEDRSIGESLKRSTELFGKNWGTQVTAGFSFGIISFLLAIPGLAVAVVLAAIHPAIGIVVGVIYLLVLAAVFSALKGIFTMVLYRYATAGKVAPGFSPELVQAAFVPRTSRW